jgi:hypothetical protein
VTLDLPGGRIAEGQSPGQGAIDSLHRELGIVAIAITKLIPLNIQGWAVNSSFSNQKLYGFVAQIQDNAQLLPEVGTETYPATSAGIHQLLQKLTCLQCRAVVLEWGLMALYGVGRSTCS